MGETEVEVFYLNGPNVGDTPRKYVASRYTMKRAPNLCRDTCIDVTL